MPSELGVLKNVLAAAVEWELVTENLVRNVKYLHVSEHKARILQPEEEIKLLDACKQVRNPLLLPIVVLALHTGMRRGELLALEWSHVDFKNRTIQILRAKTESGKRLIPLSSTAYSILIALPSPRDTQLVFPSDKKPGSRIVDVKKGFAKAIKLARIPHIRFHDLRHTFATRLARSNVDLVTLKELLGHASIRMTSHYTQSPTEAKIAAVRKLDSLDFTGFCSAMDSNRTLGPFAATTKSEANSFAAST
jgi:integrase